MDRSGIQELFDYTAWAWDRIARVIEAQPADVYTKPAVGSGWPSIAGCLSHVLGTYDGWLNGPWAGLQLGKMSYPGQWPNPVDDWAALKAYRARTRDSFQRALALPDEVLYEANIREAGAPPYVEAISLADVLANLVLHERGHHGDLNTLFHQLGIVTYLIDYAIYRSRPDRFVLDDGTN